MFVFSLVTPSSSTNSLRQVSWRDTTHITRSTPGLEAGGLSSLDPHYLLHVGILANKRTVGEIEGSGQALPMVQEVTRLLYCPSLRSQSTRVEAMVRVRRSTRKKKRPRWRAIGWRDGWGDGGGRIKNNSGKKVKKRRCNPINIRVISYTSVSSLRMDVPPVLTTCCVAHSGPVYNFLR